MTLTVVVTGASGFIGRALLAELAGRGVTNIGVARRDFDAPEGTETVLVDDYDETPFHEDAALVHLAEGADIGEAGRQGEAYVDSLREQVQALLARGWRRFVYASSGIVYGSRETHPHGPSDPTHPDSVYARAKLAAERPVLDTTGGAVARIANVYGAPVKPGTVLADIMAQIPGSGPLSVRDATPARDFIWVGDVASGLADIALGEATGIFNLGTGTATSTGDLARTVLSIAGEEAREVRSGKAADGSVDVIALDPAATTAAFGWRPRVTLEDGLRRIKQKIR